MDLVLIIAIVIIVILIGFLIKVIQINKSSESKYSDIIDIDEETKKHRKELFQLKKDFYDKKQIYNSLIKDVAIYSDEMDLIELGFYKPIFDFDTSEKFKNKIQNIKNQQKSIVSNKEAVYCTTEWSVEGSKVKGKTFSNKLIRLTSRAFNNECDATIAKVKWNNIDRMILRIKKAFDIINKMNVTNSVVISDEYLNLKLKELQLTYEYAEKKQQEKEEQAEIRHQMREEAKLEKETEDAIKEEEKYKKLLDKAKKDAEKLSGDKLHALQGKLQELEKALQEAHQKSERALSMAQQTKAGHIYIISNIGSFGEDVYKIGMTRRLEPYDRVKELGDASVPFIFDVHAMIYSDNAPALEKQLHKKFELQRVNLVNNRKEFFHINLNEIKDEAHKISPEAEFIETIEARDYKESMALRQKYKETNENSTIKLIDKFPNSI